MMPRRQYRDEFSLTHEMRTLVQNMMRRDGRDFSKCEMCGGKVSCATALDASFWQSLGKALGWKKKRWGRKMRAEWWANAYSFYGLLLAGKDTDEFWEKLLAPMSQK